ncbi:hypothetical protein EAI30_03120 [Romboutsia ilealis]|uniref:Pesticidal crystal protein Cry22Aa Ig-like domain-containing protein n=1 Tax=Romboutsia faecis TaxID=2764597 RepID=A0ABR7JR19_9FIRM|nr:hypothetical protein [Romboutsia faecis]MBC5997319.1 hypothetical protein [Romboutsia faecis]MRN23601.1 hypothetical protein [Romboutsia ilealis]
MKQDFKNITITLILSIVIISQYNLANVYALFENPPSQEQTIESPNTSTDSNDVIHDDTSTTLDEDNYSEEDNIPSNSVESVQTEDNSTIDNPTPIEIRDVNLVSAINNALGIDGSTEVINSSNILSLEELDASNLGITDLSGLESAKNLSLLNLSDNNIKDVTPLSSLDNLNGLFLNNNNIIDLSPVANIAQKIITTYGTDDTKYGFQAYNQTYTLETIKSDKGSDITLILGGDISQPINMYKETANIESINPSGNIDGTKISLTNIQESSEYQIKFFEIEGWSFTYYLGIEINNSDSQKPNDTDKPIPPDNNNEPDEPATPDNNDEPNNNNTTIVDIDNNSNNTIVDNDITVITKIKNVINKNTFISKLSKIKINAKDQSLYVGDLFEPMKNVTAIDSDGSDITKNIIVSDNTVVTNKNNIATQSGQYKVTYEVTGKSRETVHKTINISVYNYGEEKVENVKTGDNSIIIFCALGIIAILALIVVNIILRKRK